MQRKLILIYNIIITALFFDFYIPWMGCHLCVSMFGGTQQWDHPSTVGYFKPRPSTQEEGAYFCPPSACRCAQNCQRNVGIKDL